MADYNEGHCRQHLGGRRVGALAAREGGKDLGFYIHVKVPPNEPPHSRPPTVARLLRIDLHK